MESNPPSIGQRQFDQSLDGSSATGSFLDEAARTDIQPLEKRQGALVFDVPQQAILEADKSQLLIFANEGDQTGTHAGVIRLNGQSARPTPHSETTDHAECLRDGLGNRCEALIQDP